MAYATLDLFRARFSITDSIDDVQLQQALDTASAMIDEDTQLGPYSALTATTRYFTPTRSDVLYVPPLISITTLKTDDNDDGTYETTWSASDYELDTWSTRIGQPYEIIRALTRSFPTTTTRKRIVQIVGSWGWSTTPDQITEATLLLASRLFRRQTSPLGVQSLADGGQLFIRSSDPDYRHLIAPFTRISVA